MASELKCGNFDAFCDLMNTHWTLSKLITPNTTNECIESILSACEDLTEARFITGAGGGGFLIIILKKGVSKEVLRERLKTEFKDTNVDVWETEFV